MINRVVVVGGGSAGFLAAIGLKHRVPALDVTVIRSRSIGIIGVGEATTLVLPYYLHNYLGFDMREFYAQAEPQWKLGIRFLWGKRPWFDFPFGRQLINQYEGMPKVAAYYCGEGPFDYVGKISSLMTLNKAFVRAPNGMPVVDNSLAYHIENETFVGYLEKKARQAGVKIIDATILNVTQNEQGIAGVLLDDQSTLGADLWVDCSGFVSLLLGKTLREPFESFKSSLFNDRAVTGGWKRDDEPIQPYTTAETMHNGWCWRIDHERRINRGYVYSSAFVSDEEAQREFVEKNPKAGDIRLVKFVSGKYARAWVKNVVAIGNSMGFVEPLESTALAMIALESQNLCATLFDCGRVPNESMRRQYNKCVNQHWDAIRQFLSIHFRFNTRYDTPYWRECREKADIVGAAEIVDYFRENGPSILWQSTLFPPGDQFGPEGYLSMLVGMQVPYKTTYVASAEDLSRWNQIRAILKKSAEEALSVNQALAAIRSPQWVWPKIYV